MPLCMLLVYYQQQAVSSVSVFLHCSFYRVFQFFFCWKNGELKFTRKPQMHKSDLIILQYVRTGQISLH